MLARSCVEDSLKQQLVPLGGTLSTVDSSITTGSINCRFALAVWTLNRLSSLFALGHSSVLARSCEEDSPTEQLAPSSWPLKDFGSLHNYRFSRILARLVALDSRVEQLTRHSWTL